MRVDSNISSRNEYFDKQCRHFTTVSIRARFDVANSVAWTCKRDPDECVCSDSSDESVHRSFPFHVEQRSSMSLRFGLSSLGSTSRIVRQPAQRRTSSTNEHFLRVFEVLCLCPFLYTVFTLHPLGTSIKYIHTYIQSVHVNSNSN